VGNQAVASAAASWASTTNKKIETFVNSKVERPKFFPLWYSYYSVREPLKWTRLSEVQRDVRAFACGKVPDTALSCSSLLKAVGIDGASDTSEYRGNLQDWDHECEFSSTMDEAAAWRKLREALGPRLDPTGRARGCFASGSVWPISSYGAPPWPSP